MYVICRFGLICRYTSRAHLIPFKEPSIGPKSTEESVAFATLSCARKNASQAIGWVISLRKCLVEEEGAGFKEIREMLPTVMEKLPKIDPRLCMGYATSLYFAKKVYIAVIGVKNLIHKQDSCRCMP